MPRTLIAKREEIRIRSGMSGYVSTWLPVVLGLAVIALESTRTMSADKTSHFLRPIFERIFGAISETHWNLFHHLLRKSGHFLGYGTLGMLWARAWLRNFSTRSQWTLAQWRIRSCSAALVCTFLTASADEYHQTLLPSRTGQFSDVLLDTCGALLFTLIVATLWRRRAVK
jgi:VanZ family protein